MKTFTDNAGRTWTVALNVTTLKRVKSLCGVDVLDSVNDGGKLLNRLSSDPVLLCDVIFALCKDQAVAKEISDQDFGCAMAGDSIESATTAFLEELVDFFRGEKRKTLQRSIARVARYEEKFLKAVQLKLEDPKMDEAVDRVIERMNARMDQAVERVLDSTPGDSSGSAPAS